MESKELKTWIDTNVKNIEIKEYEDFFTKKTGYCPSKWKSDFKDLVGMTLRNYLIEEKMRICWDYKMKNKDYSNNELMAIAGYDLTERRFRTHLREYELKYLNEKTSDVTKDIYLFHNTAIFSEILVRLILHLDLAKPKIEENSFGIEHNVEGTMYLMNYISQTETAHFYRAYIGLNNVSLTFMGPWVRDTLDNEKEVRFYNDISVYVHYLSRISYQIQEQIGLTLTDSIKDWDNFYINNFGRISDLLRSPFNQDFHPNLPMRLEINRRSKFILATNEALNKVKEVMFNRCKAKLIKLYGVPYNTMLDYARAVEKRSYLKMKRVLETITTLNDERAIILFFELTRCPYLDDYLLSDLKSELEDDFVRKLSQSPKTKIIHFLIDLKKEIEQFADDEDYEEDIHNWCQWVAEKW